MSATASPADFVPFPGVSAGVYAREDFEAVRDLIYQEAGIVLPPRKATLVYSRLAPLVRATGSATFANYIQRIRADDQERRRAVSALTTNHTFFYREPHHFEHFIETVRPELVHAAETGKPVRLWSAGCSTGEETWSLVLSLLGPDRTEGRRLAQRDVAVLATDIADHALSAAREASYAADALKPVPEPLRRAWSESRDGRAAIVPDATALVRFRWLNLLGEWPMKKKFDVIFCRNVMIYFDQPTKERLVERLGQMLVPNGHLYIGHSERVTGAAARFLSPVGSTIYRRTA
ncbi:CheR family methyltransferase [Sphingomonas morindae]|uniref:Chemotaxis protein methyltransferase n=1 Tax=Sphingomonas morindae TaxID=1541170 RepID=A0ABY4X484_9SPHN|nr:protein-glutamate O-methyltransferase CheR [Sphingomonas morindae]USI71712.1 protein-glutamate O-methyltransferase CheR [Sphingomonas morindae]